MSAIPTLPADPAAGRSDDGAARIERWLRIANRTVLAAFLLAGGLFFVTHVRAIADGPERKCVFDWLIAACGSDATFESLILGEIEDSRKEFEKEYGDSFKPAFESDELIKLDAQALSGGGFDPARGASEVRPWRASR